MSRCSSSAAACLVALSAITAEAQSTEPAIESDEVMVVTATKREERLNEVPIAITALRAEQLNNSGVTDIRELTALAPSVQFQTPGGSSDSSIRVRGVGTPSTNPGLESSVGVVIDGVPRARTGVALSELGDLDRIEVLRGPQGTLFGRNTSAGLINILTRNPSFDALAGHLEATVGNYRNMRIAGALNVPLSEQLALRIEANVETRAGLFKDQNSNERLDDMDRKLARAKLRWQATPRLSWLLSADFTKRDESCCIAVLGQAGDTFDLGNTLAAARGERGYTSRNPFARQAVKSRGRVNLEDVTDWGVSAQGDLDLDFGQLTSITAYRSWHVRRAQDFDHSGIDLGFVAPNGLHQGFDVLSQELRLRGEVAALHWLVGGFFSWEKAIYDSTFRMGADYPAFFGGADTFQESTLAAFTPGDGARGIGKQASTDLSVFTHDTYQVTEQLSLTAGLRYTFNRKSLDYRGENFNPACDSAVATADTAGIARLCAPFWDTRFDPAGDTDARTEHAVTGTFNVAYAFAPNVHAFLSYSRGYKSGGYQFDRAGFSTPATPDARDLSFPEETVNAYEAGLKADLPVVSAHLALFRQSIEGLQLIEYNGTFFVVRSLAHAVSTGAELELSWRPVTGLTISNGLTYTDAYYPNDPGNMMYAGREMEQSPDWINVSAATWEFPINARLRGLVYIDNRYTSAYYTSGFDPVREQGAFTLCNARIGVRSADGDWSFELWSRNLFDAQYFRRVFPATFQAGSFSAYLGDPRTYGITVRHHF